jgi:hypothetical protein
MKKFQWMLYMLGLLTLASCEDVIDVDLDEGQPLIAVDGWVTDQPGPYKVTLTRTAVYFNNAPTPRVQGAVVTLADNEGNIETLKESEPGIYLTSTLQGKVNHAYTLTIKVEGEEYRAQTEIRRTAPVIDSLGIEFKKETAFFDEGYYIKYFGPEIPGIGDNYWFKVIKNDTLLNKPENLIVSEDKLVDGKYINDIIINDDPFKVGDRVRVENWSITDDAYQFLLELQTQIQNSGPFSTPPANVRTNIKNVNPNGKQAVGYFGGASISKKSIDIK